MSFTEVDDSAPESPTVTREDAEKLALEIGEHDPFPKIPPSLLSAEHIALYAEKTGLVAPFFSGKSSRLKKAAYECRIGSLAFMYKNGDLTTVPFDNNRLLIPANSIVFVESELDFRLPDYIALRFNLHITHVHRGLLLGTGPLVDPGFWGKLCIPLHNLTSEPYEIPISEGLIWIEFTKTTLPLAGKNMGSNPSNRGFWDITKFIIKASRSYGLDRGVPIQSSIPIEVKKSNDQSNEAVSIAKSAQEIALLARSDLNKFGWIGGLTAAVAVVGLLYAYWAVSDSRDQLYGSYVAAAASKVSDVTALADGLSSKLQMLQVDNARLAAEIERLERVVEALAARREIRSPSFPRQER